MRDLKKHLILLLFLSNFGCVEKEIVLDAILIDDLSNIELQLFKDNSFKVSANTIFDSEVFKGKYTQLNDTIIFEDKPYDNNFIPKKVYISDNKIILRENNKGKIDTSFASYFKIRNIKF